MGAALVIVLVGLGALAAGILVGRYYVPDDRHLKRTARASRAYMRALNHLIARDHDTVIDELRRVVEDNMDDAEPYFALGVSGRSSSGAGSVNGRLRSFASSRSSRLISDS
jgi:lipopolysaccharide biosynthesis regulator YciM